MEFRLFPLVAYLASSAYLVCRVIYLLHAVYQRVKRWAHPSKMRFSLKASGKVSEENGIYIYFIGILFGGLATLWLMHIFVQEWLLVIFLVLAVMSDEIRISPTETLLLEVMVFFDLFMAHNENHQDLFEILPDFILELPAGRVRKSILESILRWRSGESFENSIDAMRGINPLLDEFVLTLQLSGWKNGPVLNIILKQLRERAGRNWNRLSRLLLIKDKIKTYLQLSRVALVTGLWVILLSSLSALNRIMPDRSGVILAILALLGSGFIFYLFQTQQWLKRLLTVSIFVIALMTYTTSLSVPIPAWIQFETISHQSDNVRNTGTVTSQISKLHQELPSSFHPATLSKLPISRAPYPTSTPIPTAIATMSLNPPELISTSIIPQDFNLCCPRSSRPRNFFYFC